MKKTLCIVVTYNRSEKLIKCLNALSKSSVSFDTLIVDNHSTDDTVSVANAFISEHRNFRLESLPENTGGAGGFNFGLKYGVKSGYDYFWLMDDDCIVKEDTLQNFYSCAEKLGNNFGFLTGKVLWRDNSLCNMNIPKTGLKKKAEDYSSELSEVIMATFVSFFITRETVIKYGFPIKDFFIWSDDIEYSRRISRNEKCYLCPFAEVLHDMESNEKVNIAKESEDRLKRYEYLYRNEVYVYRREGIKGFFYLFTRTLFHIFKVIISKSPKKCGKIKIILSSVFRGLKFHPETEYFDGK